MPCGVASGAGQQPDSIPATRFRLQGHRTCAGSGTEFPAQSRTFTINSDFGILLGFALRLLQDLERLGILSLPARQSPGRGPQKALEPGPRTAPQPALEEPLASLVPLQLQVAREREQIQAWNE